MRLYKCDRCGAEYFSKDIDDYKYSKLNKCGRYYALDVFFDDHGIMRSDYLDLCPDCLEELNRWRLGCDHH